MTSRISQFFDRTKSLIHRLKEEAARIKSEERELHALEKKVLARTQGAGEARTLVDLSTASVAKATVAVFGLIALAYFLLAIKSSIILFLIAAFLAIALDPFITRLQRWHIPRVLGILLIYVLAIGLFGVVIASFVPILTKEIPNLVSAVLGWLNTSFGVDTSVIQAQFSELQTYLVGIQQNLNRESIAAGLNVLSSVGQNALAVIQSVAGGVFSFIMVLVVAFFMILEEDGIKRFLMALFPTRYHAYIVEKASVVEEKFGRWLRGQILLMLAIGVLIFVALKAVGMNYAATLATFAGLTELIPYVGPFLGLIPALILAGSQGGFFLAVIVLAIYIGVQQLENNILVPLIMEKAVGLSPVVIMFAMLVGASFPETLNPIVGIILSVPVATAISVFVHDYAEKRK